ncbi:MAG: methyltransferase, partial [Chthoniobacterales bacterium]
MAAALQRTARALPEGRGLRILEVGGGTAGLAAYVLPRLDRDLHRYVFTDASTAFFPSAQQKLASFPEADYRPLDLNRDPFEQGFDQSSFDFIIGTNVLHAAADLRATLTSLHRLLAPGGTLAFVDVASPRIWTESVFGLTDGWWSMTDEELRPVHPLLPREKWARLLLECGFAETADVPGLVGVESGESQFLMLARKAGAPAAVEDAADEIPAQRWLVFAGDGAMDGEIVAALGAKGSPCIVVRPGAGFAAGTDGYTIDPANEADWAKLASAISADLPRRALYLWSLETAKAGDTVSGVVALRNLSVMLAHLGAAASGMRVDVITRGAQPVGRSREAVDAGAGALLGIFRVLVGENPHLTVRSTDLPGTASGRAAGGVMR